MKKEEKTKINDKDKKRVDKFIHEIEDIFEGITHEVENRVEMVESYIKDEFKQAKDKTKKQK